MNNATKARLTVLIARYGVANHDAGYQLGKQSGRSAMKTQGELEELEELIFEILLESKEIGSGKEAQRQTKG